MAGCELGRDLHRSVRDDDRALAEALALFASGRLPLALKEAARSGYVATAQDDSKRQASARLFGALFYFYLGEFPRAAGELTEVVELLGEEPIDVGSDVPIMHALRGALAALRGDEPMAERSFERGIRAAIEAGDSYREAIVRAARADLLASRDPHRAEADARFALPVFARVGDEWFEVWARRGRAKALEFGNVEMSVLDLQDLCHDVSNPLERARTELALGRVLVTAGRRDEGVAVLRRAAHRFKWYQASWFQAQTLGVLRSVLRQVDHDAAERLRARLEALAEDRDDPAWEVVRLPPHRLRISLLGPRPGAILDGAPLTLRPRSLALLAAIVTGEATSRRELQAILWPEDYRTRDGQERTTRRLRDALNELRESLGEAACRLSKRDDPVGFDMHGVEVDYLVGLALNAEAQAADCRGDAGGCRNAALDALAILDKPFLGTLGATWDWVAEKDDYLRDEVVAQLREWGSKRSERDPHVPG